MSSLGTVVETPYTPTAARDHHHSNLKTLVPRMCCTNFVHILRKGLVMLEIDERTPFENEEAVELNMAFVLSLATADASDDFCFAVAAAESIPCFTLVAKEELVLDNCEAATSLLCWSERMEASLVFARREDAMGLEDSSKSFDFLLTILDNFVYDSETLVEPIGR